jgi:hypothetical protein
MILRHADVALVTGREFCLKHGREPDRAAGLRVYDDREAV